MAYLIRGKFGYHCTNRCEVGAFFVLGHAHFWLLASAAPPFVQITKWLLRNAISDEAEKFETDYANGIDLPLLRAYTIDPAHFHQWWQNLLVLIRTSFLIHLPSFTITRQTGAELRPFLCSATPIFGVYGAPYWRNCTKFYTHGRAWSLNILTKFRDDSLICHEVITI